MDTTTSTSAPEHLVVLVHGLWGNPAHLKFLSDSLREAHPQETLHILSVQRNAGSFTYDGIELGGERVTREIEERLADLAAKGHNIQRISVIGYSLGGLIARYAIGLLYHKGLFDRIEPVNFTTFATPHLGSQVPLTGTTSYIWNVLGARTLSMSGRQLFLVDEFRDTGKPLLAVLADPENIFIKALKRFKHRSLYANAVNDKTVPFYTSSMSSTDPFVDLEAIDCNYVPGYEPVILDPENPVALKSPNAQDLSAYAQHIKTTRNLLGQIPFAAFLMLFVPIGSTLFLINSGIQSFRSRQRILLHEQGKAGIDVAEYRIPLFNEMRKEVEDIYENVARAHEQEYLPTPNTTTTTSPPELSIPEAKLSRESSSSSTSSSTSTSPSPSPKSAPKSKITPDSQPAFPTLALSSHQFAMIRALDDVGFTKYPVFIHKHMHSHAAIIRRRSGRAFEEGRVVARHWLRGFEA